MVLLPLGCRFAVRTAGTEVGIVVRPVDTEVGTAADTAAGGVPGCWGTAVGSGSVAQGIVVRVGVEGRIADTMVGRSAVRGMFAEAGQSDQPQLDGRCRCRCRWILICTRWQWRLR